MQHSSASTAPGFGATARATSMYRNLDVESKVLSSDAHQLVSLLYDGALQAIAQARLALRTGQYELKGTATNKAMRIVDEGLRASLNTEAGGELAANLEVTYEFCWEQLFNAHARNDDALYARAAEILSGLRDSWQAIRPAVEAGR